MVPVSLNPIESIIGPMPGLAMAASALSAVLLSALVQHAPARFEVFSPTEGPFSYIRPP